MGNILDYLDWRGDLTFEQSPFNEVDNLILSCFSYLELCADKCAALRREAALKKLPKAQKELLCRAWSAAGGPFSGA